MISKAKNRAGAEKRQWESEKWLKLQLTCDNVLKCPSSSRLYLFLIFYFEKKIFFQNRNGRLLWSKIATEASSIFPVDIIDLSVHSPLPIPEFSLQHDPSRSVFFNQFFYSQNTCAFRFSYDKSNALTYQNPKSNSILGENSCYQTILE